MYMAINFFLLGFKVLDLKTLTWSKVEAKNTVGSSESTSLPVAPCAGHSLVIDYFFVTLRVAWPDTFKSLLQRDIRQYFINFFFLLQISLGNKILSIAGHTKDPSETITGVNGIVFIISFIFPIVPFVMYIYGIQQWRNLTLRHVHGQSWRHMGNHRYILCSMLVKIIPIS